MPTMWQVPERFKVKLGGNTFINVKVLVAFRGQPLFDLKRSSQDGMLAVDFDVHDQKGQRVATFRKNVVVKGDTANYDIQSGHDQYTVTEKSTGRVLARVQRRGVEDAELDIWVELFLPNGSMFKASPDQIIVGQALTMQDCIISNCGTGIALN